jgi:hypothetical protein
VSVVSDGQTMADGTSFVVLRSVNKTPSIASCTKCHLKFFAPNSYYNDPYGAERYLHTKFDLHDCLDEQGQTKEAVSSRPW